MTTEDGGLPSGGPLLCILNPRRIPECIASLRALDIDQAWLTGYSEPQLEHVVPAVIKNTDYETYVLVSDDCIVSQDALDAVLKLARYRRVVTGWCLLDSTSPYSNLTRRPFRSRESEAGEYHFHRAKTVRSWPTETIPTHFAGFALTAMARDDWQRFPYRCSTPTGAADHSLALRLADAGIPITGARDGYIEHVKEKWGRVDRDPVKRLLLGQVEPNVTVISTTSIYKETVLTDKVAKEDIVQKNAYGQNVVVVPAGQAIPADLPDEPAVPITQVSEPDAPAPAPKSSAKKKK